MRRGLAILLILSIALMAKGQNVGVGIASPNEILHVYGPGILLNNGTFGSAATNGLHISFDAASTPDLLVNWQQNSEMQFWTGAGVSNLVRMRIDATGHVGINTAPIATEQLLVVNNSVNSAGLVGVGNTGSGALPGLTGFGIMGSVGFANGNVGVAGYFGTAVDIPGSSGAGLFGSSNGSSTGYGVYGIASGANTNTAGYFTVSGGVTATYGIQSIITGVATNNYGFYGSVTGTGITNTAGYFTAMGGTNNYAVIVPSGGGSVGIGTSAPDVSAIMDVSNISSVTKKGILIPQVALTATNVAAPIASPATSLLVYNTATAGASPFNVIPGYYYNSGTSVAPIWVQLITSGASVGSAWLTTGNGTTSPGTFAAPGANFIGTTDANDFAIRTNNTERMRITSAGSVGIDITPVSNVPLTVLNDSVKGSAIVGLANTNTLSSPLVGNIGVLGASGSGPKNFGVAGYSGNNPSQWGQRALGGSYPLIAGVYGENTNGSYPAIYGINSAVHPAGTGPSFGHGVFGSTNQPSSSGVYGNNTYGGAGVTGSSVSGGNTIFGTGVKGVSDGNGVYGESTTTAPSFAYAAISGKYNGVTANQAAVIGYNNNGTASSFGNVGVYGYYSSSGTVATSPYGIGILGLGTYQAYPPSNLSADFGVLGAITGSRLGGTGASVAGYIGSNTVFPGTGYIAPITASAIYGNSNNANFWALYGTGSSSTGNGLLVNGISNLIGVTTLGANTTTYTASTVNGSLVFDNASNLNTVTINSGATTASYPLKLPTAQGTANTFLTNDGAGNLSWRNLSAQSSNSLWAFNYISAGYTISPASSTVTVTTTSATDKVLITGTWQLTMGATGTIAGIGFKRGIAIINFFDRTVPAGADDGFNETFIDVPGVGTFTYTMDKVTQGAVPVTTNGQNLSAIVIPQ